MTMLVMQTFLLMAAFLAAGIGIGVVARQTADRRIQRLEAVGHPAPDEPIDDEAAASSWSPETAGGPPDDAIIDPDRAASADQVGVRPDALAGPRDSLADDLKVIRGIGPQNEYRLNALGIFHLDQIAAWSPDEARWVSAYLGSAGRIDREDWVGQARAVTGNEADGAAETGETRA